MKYVARCLLLIFLSLVICACSSIPDRRPERKRIKEVVGTLCSPKMEGRGPNTKGHKRAVKYLVRQMKAAGLEPAPGHNSFRLPFVSEKMKNAKGINLFGVCQGEATKEGFVILIAHYDHLGIGKHGKYYPGANDNAAGVAALLEVARMINSLDPEDKPFYRRVGILFTDLEESGLLGSRAFLNNSPIKRENIHAAVNVDGVGRNFVGVAPGYFAVAGTGTSRELHDILPRKGGGVQAIPVSNEEFNVADNKPFLEKKIPTLFVSATGPFYREYHKPSDQFETIDWENLSGITTYLFRLAYVLARSDTSFTWRSSSADIRSDWEKYKIANTIAGLIKWHREELNMTPRGEKRLKQALKLLRGKPVHNQKELMARAYALMYEFLHREPITGDLYRYNPDAFSLSKQEEAPKSFLKGEGPWFLLELGWKKRAVGAFSGLPEEQDERSLSPMFARSLVELINGVLRKRHKEPPEKFDRGSMKKILGDISRVTSIVPGPLRDLIREANSGSEHLYDIMLDRFRNGSLQGKEMAVHLVALYKPSQAEDFIVNAVRIMSNLIRKRIWVSNSDVRLSQLYDLLVQCKKIRRKLADNGYVKKINIKKQPLFQDRIAYLPEKFSFRQNGEEGNYELMFGWKRELILFDQRLEKEFTEKKSNSELKQILFRLFYSLYKTESSEWWSGFNPDVMKNMISDLLAVALENPPQIYRMLLRFQGNNRVRDLMGNLMNKTSRKWRTFGMRAAGLYAPNVAADWFETIRREKEKTPEQRNRKLARLDIFLGGLEAYLVREGYLE